MPEMKTHKATAKRSLRAPNKDQPVAKADRKRIRRILGLRQ